jgi:hypothetical protein
VDRDRGVLVEVVDQDDGVHGVGQERLHVPVAGRAQHRGSLLTAPVIALTYRDHLHPGLLCEAGQGGASA